ncbi:unnamed protein product [Clonostachys rosea]|uniref:RING-type domain-containing protein n=1 Tax=Bionectria ochroleuca TaxID=29856 RepID=A0ABY6UZ64_BIOOC|nr:unnamed protein product [Clonostachys rosea]
MAKRAPRLKRRADGGNSDTQSPPKRLRPEPCEPPVVIVIDSSSESEDADYQLPERKSDPQYDACFGILLVTAVSTFKGGEDMKYAAVNVEPSVNMLKLSFQETGGYAGLVKSEILAELLLRNTVKFRATIFDPGADKRIIMGKFRSKFALPRDCELRLAVYGSMADSEAIGMALGDSGLYLHHPLPSDLDRGMSYHNPHFLLRPGSEMPNLEALDLGKGDQTPQDPKSENCVIDEYNKAVFMRLFEKATYEDTFNQVSSSPRLKSTLKRHQLIALAWLSRMESGAVAHPEFPSLWECLKDSDNTAQYRSKITGLRTDAPTIFRGGILADEMGLGKTIAILSLVCGSLDAQAQVVDSGKAEEGFGPTLIITPKSTIHNWISQCERHIHSGQLTWAIYHGLNRERSFDALQKYNIVFTTYGTMRRDWTEKGPIYSGSWYRVVLDEGTNSLSRTVYMKAAKQITSRASQTNKAASAVDSSRRWCVTGTPIQNSLDDLGALINFLRVPKFMDKREFDKWITHPCKSDHPDSLRRLEVLIKATSLRRTKLSANLALKLPKKVEKVEWVSLTPEEKELYTFFEKKAAKIAAGLDQKKSKASTTPAEKETNILSLIKFLRLICNGGEKLLPSSAVTAWQSRSEESISWEMMKDSEGKCELCHCSIAETDTQFAENIEFLCLHIICWKCRNNQEDQDAYETNSFCPTCLDSGTKEKSHVMNSDGVSPKLRLLLENIRQEQNTGENDRCGLIKSSWTKMLDLAQRVLNMANFKIQRMDGRKTLQARQKAIHEFNEDPECTVLLASIGSAGEGIDLTVANNVHLLEPSWNPMAEAQAVDRIHRIGQHRDVFITRYMTRDSIEGYIQWIQQDKIRLIERSLDSSASHSEAVEHRIEVLDWLTYEYLILSS